MSDRPTNDPPGPLRFSVVHRTEYDYAAPMTDGYTVAHLLPRDTPQQRVESAAVEVDPTADEVEEQLDAFGNRVVRLGVHHPHDQSRRSSARCMVEVDVAVAGRSLRRRPASRGRRPPRRCASARGDRAVEVGPYVGRDRARRRRCRELDRAGRRHLRARRPLVDVVDELCSRIYHEFEFDSGFSDISTPIDAVLAARRGVCQDFAHLAIACLRSRRPRRQVRERLHRDAAAAGRGAS